MSTDALKIELINKIAGIADREQLEEIRNFIYFQEDESVYVTNDEEKAAIKKGLDQIAAGECKTDEEVYNEISQWLKK